MKKRDRATSKATSKAGKGCPCGGESYATCCEPLLHGERNAPDAEALMRSRYSAFALAQPDYLWRTLHSTHEDRQLDKDEWAAQLQKSGRTYRGLRIVDTREPDQDGVARVLFVVRVRERGNDASFAELSYFAQEQGEWRYVTGVIAGGKSELTIEALEE